MSHEPFNEARRNSRTERPHSAGRGARCVLGLAALLSGLAQTNLAAVNAWTTHGPEGGSIFRLAVAPSNPAVLYAATNGGVFRSVNGGGNWAAVFNGLTSGIDSLAVDPTTASTAYGGGFGQVFKTTNAGVSWSVATFDPTKKTVFAVKIDTAIPTTLYAATNGSGIFKSTDGGASWSSANNGLTSLIVFTLAIDPTNSPTLYAGTAGASVFKSANGGLSWTSVSAGLTGSQVESVVIDPLTPTTLYARVGGTLGGVFKSTNSGTSWSAINSGLMGGGGDLAIDPLTPTTLYYGSAFLLNGTAIFKTTNGGATWTSAVVVTGLDSILEIAVNPLIPSTLYVGTLSGVYKSTDGSASWSRASTGLFGTFDFTVEMDRTSPSTLYVGTNGSGSFRSVDGGISWTRMATPADAAGNPLIAIQAIAVDPSNSSTIYEAGYCCSPQGLAKSIDGGATWTTPPDDSGLPALSGYSDILVDPSSALVAYAGTLSGVFKTTNGGTNWFAVNSGLTSLSTRFLARDPNSSTIYAGAGGALFKTANGGASWSTVSGAPAGVASLAFDPTNSSILYVGAPTGVSKSLDGGASWSDSSNGLPGGVRFVGVVPSSPSTLYAASGKVYRSTNAGASWVPFGTGLPDSVFAFRIATDSTGRFIHAATSAGAFDFEIVPDFDSDGVPDSVESRGLSGGDGNGDGIPDGRQVSVASLPSVVSGSYVTLVSGSGTTLAGVRSIPNPSPGDSPLGQTFPMGFLEFTVQGLAPGSATTVTLLLPAGTNPTGYYKYGPEPSNPFPHWYPFLFDGSTGAVISGNTVTLHFVDGQRGDADLSANGRVVEPGGPSVPTELSETICRPAGFWGAHSGTEKANSLNITQTLLDAYNTANDLDLTICGQTITNTEVGSVHSALEAICVSPKGNGRLQLARELTAAGLNCVMAVSENSCPGDGLMGAVCSRTEIEALFVACNTACAAGQTTATVDSTEVSCIGAIACVNDGGLFSVDTGQCHKPEEMSCQDRPLRNACFDFQQPSSAGSPRACDDARKNSVTILP